MLEKFR